MDQVVDQAAGLAAELGVNPLAESELASETPPHTSKSLSELIALGEPDLEPEGLSLDPRDEAIAKVLEAVRARPDMGAIPERLAEDRAAIIPHLRRALDAGVPPSNKDIRDALLERWLPIIDGLPEFRVMVREVRAEMERREHDEASDPGDADVLDVSPGVTDNVERMAAELRPILAGKRLLLLGGVPRVNTAPRLQDALGLGEVIWPEAKKSDTPDKFEAEIRRSDIIVIVKNYSRHAVSEAASDICRETGAQYVMLSAGYGVARIIMQLHEQYRSRKLIPPSETTETPPMGERSCTR